MAKKAKSLRQQVVKLAKVLRLKKQAEPVETSIDKPLEEELSVSELIMALQHNTKEMDAFEQKEEENDEKSGGMDVKQIIVAKELSNLARYVGLDIHNEKEYEWILVQALRAPLPDGWTREVDPDGESQYHNLIRGITTNQHPLIPVYRSVFTELIHNKIMNEAQRDTVLLKRFKKNKDIPSEPRKTAKRTGKTMMRMLVPEEQKVYGKIVEDLKGLILHYKHEKRGAQSRVYQRTAEEEADVFQYYLHTYGDPRLYVPAPKITTAYEKADPQAVIAMGEFHGIDFRTEPSLIWIARQAATVELPPACRQIIEPDGSISYEDLPTHHKTKTHPADAYFQLVIQCTRYNIDKEKYFNLRVTKPPAEVPPNIHEFKDDLGRPYWYDFFTNTIHRIHPVESKRNQFDQSANIASSDDFDFEGVEVEDVESTVVTDQQIFATCHKIGLDYERELHLLWLVDEALHKPLTSWYHRTTLQGKKYWINTSNSKSTFEHPSVLFAADMYRLEKRRLQQEYTRKLAYGRKGADAQAPVNPIKDVKIRLTRPISAASHSSTTSNKPKIPPLDLLAAELVDEPLATPRTHYDPTAVTVRAKHSPKREARPRLGSDGAGERVDATSKRLSRLGSRLDTPSSADPAIPDFDDDPSLTPEEREQRAKEAAAKAEKQQYVVGMWERAFKRDSIFGSRPDSVGDETGHKKFDPGSSATQFLMRQMTTDDLFRQTDDPWKNRRVSTTMSPETGHIGRGNPMDSRFSAQSSKLVPSPLVKHLTTEDMQTPEMPNHRGRLDQVGSKLNRLMTGLRDFESSLHEPDSPIPGGNIRPRRPLGMETIKPVLASARRTALLGPTSASAGGENGVSSGGIGTSFGRTKPKLIEPVVTFDEEEEDEYEESSSEEEDDEEDESDEDDVKRRRKKKSKSKKGKSNSDDDDDDDDGCTTKSKKKKKKSNKTKFKFGDESDSSDEEGSSEEDDSSGFGTDSDLDSESDGSGSSSEEGRRRRKGKRKSKNRKQRKLKDGNERFSDRMKTVNEDETDDDSTDEEEAERRIRADSKLNQAELQAVERELKEKLAFEQQMLTQIEIDRKFEAMKQQKEQEKMQILREKRAELKKQRERERKRRQQQKSIVNPSDGMTREEYLDYMAQRVLEHIHMRNEQQQQQQINETQRIEEENKMKDEALKKLIEADQPLTFELRKLYKGGRPGYRSISTKGISGDIADLTPEEFESLQEEMKQRELAKGFRFRYNQTQPIRKTKKKKQEPQLVKSKSSRFKELSLTEQFMSASARDLTLVDPEAWEKKQVIQRRLSNFMHYSQQLGDPRADLGRVHFRTSPSAFTPQDVYRMAKTLKIDVVREPELLWVAHQALSIDLPPDVTEQTSPEGDFYVSRAADGSALITKSHPGLDYFRVLLSHLRFYTEDPQVSNYKFRHPLPDLKGWMQFLDGKGRTYFYNFITQVKTYSPPRFFSHNGGNGHQSLFTSSAIGVSKLSTSTEADRHSTVPSNAHRSKASIDRQVAAAGEDPILDESVAHAVHESSRVGDMSFPALDEQTVFELIALSRTGRLKLPGSLNRSVNTDIDNGISAEPCAANSSFASVADDVIFELVRGHDAGVQVSAAATKPSHIKIRGNLGQRPDHRFSSDLVANISPRALANQGLANSSSAPDLHGVNSQLTLPDLFPTNSTTVNDWNHQRVPSDQESAMPVVDQHESIHDAPWQSKYSTLLLEPGREADDDRPYIRNGIIYARRNFPARVSPINAKQFYGQAGHSRSVARVSSGLALNGLSMFRRDSATQLAKSASCGSNPFQSLIDSYLCSTPKASFDA
eukprot:GILJ01007199.1.p1 GENE.GILJ01007199.1~~GILJ01007199.1.p1  ORF type:complete len:1808 (+),score=334.07 GILJ01007199.1:73-5496(+)